MYYECLGNNNYKIIVKIYKDGIGPPTAPGVADFDNPAYFTIHELLGSGGSTKIADRAVNVSTRTAVPIEQIHPCLDPPSGIEVEEAIYEFNVVLPLSATSTYQISYERCCRNATIFNILTPDQVGATFTIDITPTAQSSCNNSPQFNYFPPIAICVNEPIDFDHSATDPEGDSLVYSFCSPFIGASQSGPAPTSAQPPPYQNVTFIPPYSAGAPMAGNPLVSINRSTGLITGVPTRTGQFVVGVCVDEYRNGVVISSTKRDFQFNVVPCAIKVAADILEDVKLADKRFLIRSCGDSIITITNQSTDQSFIQGYFWRIDVGGGNIITSSATNPTITFPGYGIYNAELVVNPGTNAACSDTADIIIEIFPPVLAGFNVINDTCEIQAIDFVDQTQTFGSTLAQWSWDMGDSTQYTTQNVSHQYAQSGRYFVTLNITDSNGCTDQHTQWVEWFPTAGIAVDYPKTGCTPFTLDFTNNSFPQTGGYDFSWTFGDGNTSNQASPTHTYTVPGIYIPTITMRSPHGCLASDTLAPIQIFVPPTPAFTFAYDSCDIQPIQFSDISQAGDGVIVNWNWEFGDGKGFSTVQNPSYAYDSAGIFTITLTIEDDNGCMVSTTRSLPWYPPTVIDFVADTTEGCEPLTVRFTNNSRPINGYQIRWTFGDGSSSTERNPVHTYSSPGRYTVGLETVSPIGCVSYDEKPNYIWVKEVPNAFFINDPEQPSNFQNEIQFTDQSTGANSWYWSFGTGAHSFQQNPLYTYVDTGRYDVVLVATHQDGCRDTFRRALDVEPRFTYFLPNAFTPNNDNINEGYRGQGIFFGIQDFNLTVWNRWGERVFETTDPYEFWNGKKDNTGDFVKNGVYVCLVTLTGPRGRKYEYKEFATIIQ